MGGLNKLKKSRVQTFATDIDDRALEVARRGCYPITAAADIPEQFLKKYFKVHDERLEVLPELRYITLFSLHNLFHDPPFLNVDFVSIRNVMIYFNAGLQNQVLHRIHYALNCAGMLFLGTSETVGNMESLFEMRAGGLAPNSFVVTRGGEMVRVFGDISHLTQLTENAPLWIGIRNLLKPLAYEIQGLIATAMKIKERRVGRWHDVAGTDFN